ncbi:MAG: FAD-binding oxidoreductase [Aliiglaciecola sp.]|uniref:FAD-binding oxidoreductase n=1 Tax=Aliiglaciecola sp. TaxID=1872441 RepID=UPI003299DD9D
MNTKSDASIVLETLATIVGQEYVLTDADSCSLYAQDVFTKDKPALAVVQPSSTLELSEVVKTATAHKYITIPRGGGMSYTSGYVPQQDNSIIIDMSRMSKIVEINEQDMYVTVECGCSWKSLYEALKDTGLRTPCWGTLSGIYATIGGGLSQNGMFWGSGQFGAIADSVISVEVVLADGSILETGSAAQINGTPFFRHFGPDLTGVFIGDTGSLGFKARATLRLMPELTAREYISMDFKTSDDALNTMSEISRRGLAMECFGFDPFLQAQRKQRESLASDAKALVGFMKSAGSIGQAIKQGSKIAFAGRGFMDDVDFSIHAFIEERSAHGAKQCLEDIRAIVKKNKGKEIENTIPKILRANPFGPVNNMVGPNGERWVPVHGQFPHSKVIPAFNATEAIFNSHRDVMERMQIGVGYLFAVISTNAFVIEPVFFWQDCLNELHEKSVESGHFSKLKKFDENLEARETVTKIKNEVAAKFSEMGGVHFQIGKNYAYKDGIKPPALELIERIKECVDPNRLVNPGSLGL